VEQEPHHGVLLENQYVRVLDAQIPSGVPSPFCTPFYDNLSVRISGGVIQNSVQGNDRPAAMQVKPEAVVFAEASEKPYTHRVKNGVLPRAM
jgi:hypothetical protein